MSIQNLIFGGGGVKGIAHVGVLKYMQENGHLKDVKNVIGTSVGSIIATCFVLNMTVNDIYNVMKNINFKLLADKDRGIIRNMYRFICKGGIYKGNMLEKLVGDILEKYSGNRNITFNQLYEKFD